ncbi:hypothetical protein HO584_06355 [Streptococcus suis]|nr:hypothetical protein [Streptococcus suis]
MAIQTMEDAHTFHYFYVAQKSSDELTTLIGVQSGIEELRKSPVYDKRPQNAFARDVITDLLAGTNWQARFVGETTPHSTNFYYTSVFDALKKVCEVWDLEMQFFVEMNGNRIGGRYIDFKQRIGEAVGKRVVYGHNALQILQEVERTNIFTALVGRGKGEETGAGYGRKITFEDVTWSTAQGKPVNKPVGQKYLELPLMTRQYGIKNADGSMRPKIGFVDFSEEENPEVLIERTYKALIDAARPQLTLKTSSVYLKGVKVGDTIRVVRHDKKLDYDTRIFEITFNRLNNQSSDIKLGDRIGESNEAKAQTIADKAVEQFVTNEFSNFVQNLPDYLPSADGFNNNWYGAEDPTVKYPGKVLINDIWYKPDPEHEGHKIMLRWTGEVWEEILRTYESESLRDRIAEEIAQVNTSMQAQAQEHDRQVADILSKTQSVESLANQVKSDAASALARANQVKTEAIADARAQVATVNQALNTAKTELQSAIASADQKARDSQASATALRNDLNVQASKILEQARAQTALTSRVSTVETLADGTKTTVAELSKTVNKATGDITSVTARTKTVEDTLSQTRTQYEALTQTVNTQTGQIESINRKTADLQSGIDGVTERFESLRIEDNLLLNSSFNQNLNQWQGTGVTIVEGKARIIGELNETKHIYQSIKSQIANDDVSQVYITSISIKVSNYVAGSRNPFLALYISGRKNDSAKTLFNAVKDTVDAHKQIIGNGDSISQAIQSANKFERYISSGGDIYRVIETAAGLVQEVSGTNGLKTQVSQLKNSWAVKISGPEGLKTAINASEDGVRFKGKNLWLDGNTLIDNAVITSAMIASLDAGKITTGYLDAARIRVGAIDGSKIAFDEAFFNGLTANQAYLKKLFAKDAFLTAVQAVTLSASQIIGGLMRATNGAMEIDFNNSAIDMFKDGAIRFHSGSNAIYRQSADGTHTAFVHFDTTSKGGIYASLGSTSSRDGINSKSSGRFAGIRVARTSERSDSHVASQDAVELYGDTIFFGHGFEGGGFSMHTTLTGGQTISLNKMHDALINLCRCWIHLRNEGFNLNSQAFRKSLDIEIHNAQQLYNTIERIT